MIEELQAWGALLLGLLLELVFGWLVALTEL